MPIGTNDPRKENFLNIAQFGAMVIEVTPVDTEIRNVTIVTENRKESVSMQTKKDESIDNFCRRIKSMLMGLANGETRLEEMPSPVAEKKKNVKTWEEHKAEVKHV